MQGTASSVASLGAALKAFSGTADVVICPPFVFLEQVATLIKATPIKLGAQTVSGKAPGAYTGQIAPSMLVEKGCEYVLVGHSERRQFCHETDEMIAEQFLAAKKAGLCPILCVGETKAQRAANLTDTVIAAQLQPLLSKGAGVFSGAMIAYEPIWAIGSGQAASPDKAQAVHAAIRARLVESDAVAKDTCLLYGGSVDAHNAALFLKTPEIDGVLVGGALHMHNTNRHIAIGQQSPCGLVLQGTNIIDHIHPS